MLEDRVILKEDQVFVVSDINGDIPAGNDLGLGFYRQDTRYLSVFELRLNGRVPILLNHSVDRAYVATFQLVNPALTNPDGSPIPRQSLSLRRTRFVHNGALHERIGLQNCNVGPVRVELELRFDADYMDIFTVRGYHSTAVGVTRPTDVTETGFMFAYDGADGLVRRTEVVFDPKPRLATGVASYAVELAPKQTFVVLVDVLPIAGEEFPEPDFQFDASLTDLERTYERWNAASTSYRTDNEVLDNGLVWRSLEDLRILCDQTPSGLYPTAGTPWYAVPFGRDALITSFQCLALNPDLAYGTLRYLADHQGSSLDPYREEEPGKILHEIRFGELARLKEIPHTPYYGTVDATPLFLVLLVELLDWTGDIDLCSELLPNVFAALEWIDRYGDLDEDGLVEYTQHSTLGVRNQGWKDSNNSLTAADGSPAALPAALVEVQGYVYHAKAGLARIFSLLGRSEVADKLRREADALRAKFDELFWVPERAFYAQALDRDKRQVQSVSSNPGHCLWSGILTEERAAQVVERLLAPDLFSGWGIRTLSSQEPSYNPMSYHNGSVWPHDNSIIAAGMRRYGFRREAELVARSVLEAVIRFTDDRVPELFCGFARDRRFNSGPGQYLVSCSPQAWGAGALFHFLQTLCGVHADVFGRRLRIDPLETPLFDRLRVEGMRVGDGTLDFTVDRSRGRTRVRVDRRPSGLELELPA
ncbi:MAG TPA: amylo-alpha-1,6-glucosidase [Candidatus Dormibacteraeota bacterium]